MRLVRRPGEIAGLRNQPPSSPAASGDDTDTRVPHIDPDLIAYLELRFPDRLPQQGTPERMVDHLIGQRAVVDHLISLLKRQEQDALQP